MRPHPSGFSALEFLMAIAITTVLSTLLFQLFRQNESVFRRQNLWLEMQQAGRAAAAQIGEDLRRAGQGVPVYSVLSSGKFTEDTVVFLNGTDGSHLRFRAGLSNIESRVTNVIPFDAVAGTPLTLFVEQAALFSASVGADPEGRHVYLLGQTEVGEVWLRAGLTSIAATAGTLTILPVASNVQQMRFAAAPVVMLEEAISVFHDAATRSLRRATAMNMSDPMKPTWAPANEIATNVESLSAVYYDAQNNVVTTDTLEGRARVARVDVRIVFRNAAGEGLPAYSVSLRTTPPNLRLLR